MVNSQSFVSKKEILRDDFEEFKKSNPQVLIISDINLSRYHSDKLDEIKKSQDNEELFKAQTLEHHSIMKSFVGLDILEESGTSSKVFLQLGDLINMETMRIEKSLVSDILGISHANVGEFLEKSGHTEEGSIKEFAGKKFKKCDGKWSLMKAEDSDEGEEETETVDEVQEPGEE